MGVCK